MTPSDPTDNALAAIASILDHSKARPEPRPDTETESGFHFQSSPPVPEEQVADAGTDREPEPELKSEPRSELTPEPTPEPKSEPTPEPEPGPAPEPVDVAGYTKSGPGPFDALRFRWRARRDDEGKYYVDETIGPGSRPLSSGPMPADQVIGFIDERERVARERFDALKREMSHGGHRAPDRDRNESES